MTDEEIGQLVADRCQRRLAVAGGDNLIALAFEPQLQDLDIVGHVVDDKDQRRLAHSPPPKGKRFTAERTLHHKGHKGCAKVTKG